MNSFLFDYHVVDLARSWIGTPYRHQASIKGVGADCLGLVRGVWRDFYDSDPEKLPPYSRDWAELDPDDRLLKAAERHLRRKEGNLIATGDVLLFRYREGLPCKHIAIASNETHMIHAYDRAAVVETVIGPWWRRRLAAVFRFPEIRP